MNFSASPPLPPHLFLSHTVSPCSPSLILESAFELWTVLFIGNILISQIEVLIS